MDIDNQSIVSGNYHKLTLTTPVAHKIPEVIEYGGGTLTPKRGKTSIVSDGYFDGESVDENDKLKFLDYQRQEHYKITANGSGYVNKSPVTKQVLESGFSIEDTEPVQISAEETIESNNEEKSYYIKKSTISTNNVTPTADNQFITVTEGYYPEDRHIVFYGIKRAAPETSFSSENLDTYFNKSSQEDYDVRIIPEYSNEAGYVENNVRTNNGGTECYKIKRTEISKSNTTIDNQTVSRGEATWGEGWINSGSILPATFTNAPVNNTSYVDISDSQELPVLQSDGCLYINAGYVDNIKLDLNKILSKTN